MTKFDDAQELVSHSVTKFEEISNLHKESLEEQVIKPILLIEIKNFMENLRSALDYSASALFVKYGNSKKAKIYFPYAKFTDDSIKFRTKIIERSIPGLLQSRSDIVDKLESYQHFGSTGDWLPLFMELINKNKHEHLTPQVQKEYTMVRISGSLPPGGSVEIDLKKIPIGGGPDKPFNAVASKWTGLEFATNGVLVLPFLEYVLINVQKIVNELKEL